MSDCGDHGPEGTHGPQRGFLETFAASPPSALKSEYRALACGQAVHRGAARASGLDPFATLGPSVLALPWTHSPAPFKGGPTRHLYLPGFTLLRASRSPSPQHHGPLGCSAWLLSLLLTWVWSLPWVFGAPWEEGRAAWIPWAHFTLRPAWGCSRPWGGTWPTCQGQCARPWGRIQRSQGPSWAACPVMAQRCAYGGLVGVP